MQHLEAVKAAIPSLRASGISLCVDVGEADALARDTLLAAWSRMGSLPVGSDVQHLLFTAARDLFRTARHKQWREDHRAGQRSGRQIGIKYAAENWLALSHMRAAFAKLPEEERRAMVLLAASGFSFAEAARNCGCPVQR